MTHAEFVFKNGKTLDVDLKSITKNINGLGDLHSFKWEHGKDRLLYLDIENLDAVVWHADEEASA